MDGVVKMKADDLHRLLYNVKLFQVGADANPVTLEFASSFVVASIDDNHTYVQDNADADVSEGLRGFMNLPQLSIKEMELRLRDIEGDVELTVAEADIYLDGVEFPATRSHGPGLKNILSTEKYLRLATGTPYAVKSEHARKQSLLKPGGYPIDTIRVLHEDYGELLLFKAGPSCRGAIVTMDRETLEEMSGSDLFLW